MKHSIFRPFWNARSYGALALSIAVATLIAQSAHAVELKVSPGTTGNPQGGPGLVISNDSIVTYGGQQNSDGSITSSRNSSSQTKEERYLQQILAALPAGVNLQSATNEQLAAAIAQVIIANKSTPNAMVEIVTAAIKATQPNQAVAVAEGVAKAIAQAPALATEAPKVTKAIGQALASKEGTPKELGTALGNATSEIVKALDKSNTTLITDTVTSALTAAPALDFTAAAYETVMETIRQIDTGNVIEDKVTQNVIENVSREIAEQIIPNVDGQAPDAKAITDNQTQQPNNIENTGDRPIESQNTPL